jgi:NADH:ubiquinone oxidoreductase subunit F (NADH-binding)
MISETFLPRLLSSNAGSAPSAGELSANRRATALLEELDASGLTGRGGAAFPTAIKARLLREHRSRLKAVVVNAMEGEPASLKDATLLSNNPHLVLEGAEALASIIGTHEVIVCVAEGRRSVLEHVQRAIDERSRRSGRGATFTLRTPPARYISGEESALTHWLDQQQALPLYRPQRPTVLTIGRQALLVDNAETCAQVALIARHGAEWFRSVGTAASAGSTLVTVSGAVETPTVFEVALGTPLRHLLETARADTHLRAVLLGGYGGSWLDASLVDTPYANEALSHYGASIGSGVVVALGEDGCGIAETARIATWMAAESAHQCGPCAFGLPALAKDLAELAGGRGTSATLARLEERCQVIPGRSACHHPNGVVRLVQSALEVFRHDARAHANAQPCQGASSGRQFARVPRAKRVALRP